MGVCGILLVRGFMYVLKFTESIRLMSHLRKAVTVFDAHESFLFACNSNKVCSTSTSCNVFVVGALGLRFDHAIANVHMLFKVNCGPFLINGRGVVVLSVRKATVRGDDRMMMSGARCGRDSVVVVVVGVVRMMIVVD